jgi:hypothetical protein
MWQVPIYQSVLIISLIVYGGVYFDEFKKSSSTDIGFFIMGCAICLGESRR